MKKKILMIGNPNNLRGVPVDVSSYYSFFTSPAGGNWCGEEIKILTNTTRRELFNRLMEIENADCDYVITIFVGHGFEADGETVLVLNEQGDMMTLDDLTNLSPRQLLIIDCCRVPMPRSIDFTFERTGATRLSMSRDPIRRAYEDRIGEALPQEVILFACDEGEAALDFPDGGAYSQYLLDATRIALANSDSPFVSVSQAHYRAVRLMQRDSFVRQHPQILQPRCAVKRQLPLGVNGGGG